MTDQWKLYMVYPNGSIFNDLERPLPPVSVSPFFDAEYLRNSTRCRQFYNGILIVTYMRYSSVSFQMTLSDLGKYSMTRSVALSLRQLSFLLLYTKGKRSDACDSVSPAGAAWSWLVHLITVLQSQNWQLIGSSSWCGSSIAWLSRCLSSSAL